MAISLQPASDAASGRVVTRRAHPNRRPLRTVPGDPSRGTHHPRVQRGDILATLLG
jgi:hypothetical protein